MKTVVKETISSNTQEICFGYWIEQTITNHLYSEFMMKVSGGGTKPICSVKMDEKLFSELTK